MERETAEEIKRHFNDVAENLRYEIRTVAERLDNLQDRVSAVFKGVQEEFDEIKSAIRLSSCWMPEDPAQDREELSSCDGSCANPRGLPA